jgi:Tat protein secretion system quality control protein TatD with DNase activity
MRLFDCHCHYHLGPGGVAPLLRTLRSEAPHHDRTADAAVASIVRVDDDDDDDIAPSSSPFSFAGAALMSTHPRDYPAVGSVASELESSKYGLAVPCYGVHPWFLHEVLPDGDNDDDEDEDDDDDGWLAELRRRLVDRPGAIVGEIGLDGARWREAVDGTGATAGGGGGAGGEFGSKPIRERKRTLSCPMNVQKRAFEGQLVLATELRRPVSIHVVHAWGELFDSLETVRDTMRHRRRRRHSPSSSHSGGEIEGIVVARGEGDDGATRGGRSMKKEAEQRKPLLLPPKMYFHAFSGKAGVLPSLLAACEKGNIPRGDVYFGFAPVRSVPPHVMPGITFLLIIVVGQVDVVLFFVSLILSLSPSQAISNFHSAKTPSIMKQIGIDQLLLETDLEDSSCAWDDLKTGVEGLASALDMDVGDVADRTYRNAMRFYFENGCESGGG